MCARSLLLPLLFFLLLSSLAYGQTGNSIGINLVGGRAGGGGDGSGGTQGNFVTGTAGVVPQANWNNALGNPGNIAAGNVVDRTGAVIPGATVSWSGSPNGWTVSGAAAADANAQLMNGYLDTNTTSATTVNINGVTPFKRYEVILYYDGDGTGRSGNYNVNGLDQVPAVLQDNANWNVGGGGNQFNDATVDGVGNFATFGDNDTPQNVTITSQVPPDGNFRAPLNGIQLVQQPFIDVLNTDGNWSLTENVFQPVGHLSFPTADADEGASDLGPFDVQIEVTGIPSFDPQTGQPIPGQFLDIAFDKHVENLTDTTFTDFHMELGTGLGSAFVPSTEVDGLEFLVNTQESGPGGPFFDEPSLMDDMVWFLSKSAPGLDPGEIANFWVGIRVPDEIDGVIDGRAVFTLRQLATVVPEPASVAIWSLIGLGLAGFGYYRVRRRK